MGFFVDIGGLDFFNVFYKVHLYSTYVLINVAIDLLYHGALILDEFFLFDKYFSKEYIPWKKILSFLSGYVLRH